AGQLELDTRVEGLLWITCLPIGLGRIGCDPILSELVEGVAKLAMVLVQAEIGRIHPHKLLSDVMATVQVRPRTGRLLAGIRPNHRLQPIINPKRKNEPLGVPRWVRD